MSISLDRRTMADKETVENPFDYFAQIRAEDPVHYDAGINAWLITTYEDLQKASTMSEISMEMGFTSATRPNWMDDVEIFMTREGYGPHRPKDNFGLDGPEHARRRAMVAKSFAGAAVSKLEPGITSIITDLLSGFLPAGQADFVKEFAMPVPILTICGYLGLPRTVVNDINQGGDSLIAIIGGGATKDNVYDHARRLMKLQGYVVEKIKERRETPGDDLLSQLIHVEVEDPAQPRLSDVELLSISMVAVTGGGETIRNTLSWAIYTLATKPDILKRLQDVADQDKEIGKFVEEVLRFHSPVSTIPRGTKADIKLGGRVIPKDSNVFLCWGAGNRDPARFPNPDVFDMDRPGIRSHFAFGTGPHFCVGAMLARVEVKCAIREVVNRVDTMNLAVDRLDMTGSMIMLRGPRVLPVKFTLKTLQQGAG